MIDFQALQIRPGCESQLQAALEHAVDPAQMGYSVDDRPSMIFEFVGNGVAMLRVHGPLMRRRSWYYASYAVLMEDLAYLEGNAAVSGVVLDIDSPGGEAIGCSDACMALEKFSKPLVGFVSGYCTSAALRLACHCDQILAGQDAEVGNIGTRVSYDDYSEANKLAGVKRLDFVTGWAKAIGSRGSEITPQQQAFLQNWVEELQGGFVQSLQARGLSATQIAAVSSGEWWRPAAAQRLGLIDGVSTLADVVAKLGASPQSFGSGVRQEIMSKETKAGEPNVAPLAQAVQSQVAVEPEQSTETPAAAGVQTPVQSAAPAPAAVSPAAVAPVQAAPVQTAPVQAAQAPAEQPATYQQIVDACEGHQPSAEFIVAQQKAGATPSQVRKAFIDQLVAATASQSAPAGAPAAQFRQDSGSDSGTKTGDADPGDPMFALESAIDELVKGGMPRPQAFRQVTSESPDLLQAFQEANRSMTAQQKAARKRRNCGAILATTMKAAE